MYREKERLQKDIMAEVEFAVNMTCGTCENTVRESLKEIKGIESVDVNVVQQQVIVKSSVSSHVIQRAIESTGLLAVLRGQGTNSKSIGAAVSILKENGIVRGLVRFNQLDSSKCLIDGSFNGLLPGKHGLHIHELGDLSQGCESLDLYMCCVVEQLLKDILQASVRTGNDYNPNSSCHGNRFDPNRHVGDLGNVSVDENGDGVLRYEDDLIKVKDIIGRALVIHENEDDLSNAPHGNAGKGIACGIIARSAGLFENTKKICACTGKTLWEERIEIKELFAT